MPIEFWGNPTGDFSELVGNRLLVFDVDESDSEPSLVEVIELNAEDNQDYYIYAGEDRSIQTTSGIYYLRANALWFHTTIAGDELNGPY